jgi:prepilin-type N-terminal cleavage/methylation domain-containing protein
MTFPRRAGFTLIELAVVLGIVALILVTLLPSLRTTIESRRYVDTRQLIENAKEALIGYAQINGRLPCPATSTSVGKEKIKAGSSAEVPQTPVATDTYGECEVWDGFLPAATLGLGSNTETGLMLDGWATPASQLRYALTHAVQTNVSGVAFQYYPYTLRGGIKRRAQDSGSGLAQVAGEADLDICAPVAAHTLGSACATVIATRVPAVVWSIAANAPTDVAQLSVIERENLNGDSRFMSSVPLAAPGLTNALDPSGFDDVVGWLSSNVLFARLIQAGQLP